MPTVHTKDRRTSERVTFPSPLMLTAPDGAEPARLRNLSVAGISCTTACRYPEMAQLKITLDLEPATPDGAPGFRLEVNGAVVRCRPLRHGTGKRRFEVALYFTDLGDAARKKLTELVRSRVGPAAD
jgi:hypothetical protein